jgi:hypothetical protein
LFPKNPAANNFENLFGNSLFAIEQNVVTLQPLKLPARVAELVDAADSKSAAFTGVLVRFQSRALSTFGNIM